MTKGMTRPTQGRSGRQDSRQIPHPWTVRDEPEEHPWPGSPFGGEALAVFQGEIAPSDCDPRRRDVALDQLGHPARLHAMKRPDGLEDDQDALRVAGQMTQLHIALGDHDLEGFTGPAVPHGNGVSAAVLAVGRQHCGKGGFQQRPHRFDPSSAHPRSLEASDQPSGDAYLYALTDEPAYLQTDDDEKPAIIPKPPPDLAKFKCWFCRKSHQQVHTLFGAEYPVRDPHDFANETLIFTATSALPGSRSRWPRRA
jgi:hypothetical protein